MMHILLLLARNVSKEPCYWLYTSTFCIVCLSCVRCAHRECYRIGCC